MEEGWSRWQRGGQDGRRLVKMVVELVKMVVEQSRWWSRWQWGGQDGGEVIKMAVGWSNLW